MGTCVKTGIRITSIIQKLSIVIVTVLGFIFS